MDTYYPSATGVAPSPLAEQQPAGRDSVPATGSNALAPSAGTGVIRDERGRLVKGSRPIPGAGRPKGVGAFAKSIREEIGYDALRNYAECIWRGWQWDGDTGEVVRDEHGQPVRMVPPPADADRRWAWQQLADRGWGKPVSVIDVHGMPESADLRDEGPLADVDVDELPDEMLAQLEAVVTYRIGVKPRPRVQTRTAIDVPAVEVGKEESPPSVEVPEPDDGACAEEPSAPVVAPEPVTPRERFRFVGSSNLDGYAYDAASSIVTVRFAGGAVYQYANVTPELLAEWRCALSAGKWLAARLKAKPDLFPCRQVTAAEWERP